MPKKRNKENKGLPERWRYIHGAYYYRVPEHLREMWGGKTSFRLGKTLIEAHRTFAQRADVYTNSQLIGQLCDKYSTLVMPTKAVTTQDREYRIIEMIKKVFDTFPVKVLKPQHVYKFRNTVMEQHGVHTANRAVSILSHMYTCAIEWGDTDEHPIKQKVLKLETDDRERYIEDWELQEFLSVAGDLINAYVPFKQLVGRRKGEILAIKIIDLKEDGIHIIKNKQRAKKLNKKNRKPKKIIIEWTDELREAVANIRSLPRKVGSLYLFHTRTGQPYLKANGRADGFNSIWNRKMHLALEKTTLQESFSEHDIRAKTSSDTTEQHAIDILDHADPKLTKRVYRRKDKVVKPHSLRKEE